MECTCLFLPPRHRPSPVPRTLSRSASRVSPSKPFHDGSLFRDCSHFVMFRPPDLLASPIVPTAAAYSRRAAEAFTSELNMLRCLRMHRICNHPPRQLAVWGITPHEIHSLVGCSSALGMFQQLHGLDNPPPTNSLPPHAALIAVSRFTKQRNSNRT